MRRSQQVPDLSITTILRGLSGLNFAGPPRSKLRSILMLNASSRAVWGIPVKVLCVSSYLIRLSVPACALRSFVVVALQARLSERLGPVAGTCKYRQGDDRFSTEDRSTGPMHCYSYLMVGLKRHGHSDHAAPNAVSENVRDRRDNIRNSEIDAVGTSILRRADRILQTESAYKSAR